MLWIAILFAAGITAERFLNVGIPAAVSVSVAVVVVSALRRNAAPYLLPFLFIPLGITSYVMEQASISDDRVRLIYSRGLIASHDPVELEGVLVAPPEPAYQGLFFKVRVQRIRSSNIERPASGNVRLFGPSESPEILSEYERLDLRYGSRVRISCRLEREDRYLNPGVASRVEILDQQGIDAVATIKSPRLIQKLGDESVFLPIAWVYEQRQRLIASFRTNFSQRTAGVIIASLLGDKHFLDRDTAEAFREGGTFHVLVISGLHITFIGGLTLWLVSIFTKRTRVQVLLAAGILWAYTLAVGAEIPVVRASLMFSILILSRLINRQGSLLNALGTCTLLLLVWRPGDLFSASFQLTFVSVAAIVGCAFPLIEKLRAIGGWTPTTDTPLPPKVWLPLRRFCELLYWNEASWRIENARQIWSANLFKSPYLIWLRAPNVKSVIAYLCEGILVSLVVQIWMLPLLVIYFHRISAVSVFLNLWVGFFLALESFSALLAVLLSGISMWLAAPLIGLTELLNYGMMTLPWQLSELDLGLSRIPIYSGDAGLIYWLYTTGVALAAVSLFHWDPFQISGRTKGSRLFLSGATLLTFILGLIIVFHPFSSPAPDGKLKVQFLDVGQGDSVFITFPGGETMLVDGGGMMDFRNTDSDVFEADTPRIGEFVVSEFLWEQGYSRVDYLLSTHADADHLQGLIDVARNFEIGTVILSPAGLSDPKYAELLSVCEKRRLPLSLVGQGDEFDFGGSLVQILSPVKQTSDAVSSNNASIVLRVGFGSHAILLTGDIERESEASLTSDPEVAGALRADIAKVPHHGSRTSSSSHFVETVDPTVAVMSVGRRSRFGHPHPEVVDRWRNAGATVLTTGERGTVTITTDGAGLEIRTFVQ